MPRTELKVGEDTIEQAHVVALEDGTKRLQWRICLSDGTVKKYTTQGRYSIGDIRMRAKAKAREVRATDGKRGSYTLKSKMGAYVRETAIPHMEALTTIRPNTKRRYRRVLELFADHTAKLTIASASRMATLEKVFQAINDENGSTTAKQAIKVVSKYVMERLISPESLIEWNPLKQKAPELERTNHKAKKKPMGGRALPPADRQRVIDHLLTLDPESEDLEKPKRGRYTLADRIAQRRLVIDVTLVQSECGMRLNEVLHLTPADLGTVTSESGKEYLTLRVTSEVSKTKKGRTAVVMDDRIAECIRARSEAVTGAEKPLFHAPACPDKLWDRNNAQKAVRRLYDELADTLGIPMLREVSSHVWRATINTEWMNMGIPAEIRAEHFGHDEKENVKSYTDLSDQSALIKRLEKTT